MQWYEAEVRGLEQQREAGLFPKNPIVFYGGSSIRLWTTLKGDIDRSVVNLGFGGATLAACDYFFDRLVTPLKPCSLVVYAGDNDLGDGRTPEEVLASFRSLTLKIDRLAERPVFSFISIKPSIARWSIDDRIRRTNKLVHNEMAGLADSLFIDIYPAMLGPNGSPKRELFEPDGLHLSTAGYRVWTDILKLHRNRIVTAHPFRDNINQVPFGYRESRVSSLVQSEPEP